MNTWDKLAELIESWKRFPQEKSFLVQKLNFLIQNTRQDEEKAAIIFILASNFRTRPVEWQLLSGLAAEVTTLPAWIINHAFEISGDKAESVSGLLPPPVFNHLSAAEIMDIYLDLKSLPEAEKKSHIRTVWENCSHTGRWLFHKIITGSYSSPVPEDILSVSISSLFNCSPLFANNQLKQLADHRFDISSHFIERADSMHSLPGSISIPHLSFFDLPESPDPREVLILPANARAGYIIVNMNEAWLISDTGHQLYQWTFPSNAPSHILQVFYIPEPKSVPSIWIHGILSTGEHIIPASWMARKQWMENNQPIFLNTHKIQPASYSSLTTEEIGRLNSFQHFVLINIVEKSSHEDWGYALQPDVFSAKAMLMYIKRGTHSLEWEELTLGMKHPDFPQLVPVARFSIPTDCSFLTEWKKALQALMGDRFGPVTTILPGWQVELAVKKIEPSKKHKGGYWITAFEILNGYRVPDIHATDDIQSLFQKKYGFL